VAPNVNIFETQEGYVLQAEMPGVGKDGLEVTLEGTESPSRAGAIGKPPRAKHSSANAHGGLPSCVRIGSRDRYREGLCENRAGSPDGNAAEIRACETSKNYGGLRRVLFTAPRARIRRGGFVSRALGRHNAEC